ncbi:MAG: FG-GAP-like repeat-containing protein [Vulcanimicrobiota bacterium]
MLLSRQFATLLMLLLLAGCGQLETGTSAAPDQPVAGLSGDGLIDYVRQGPTGSQVGLSQQAFGGERYVVFHTAEALISTDTNGVEDVYLMDLLLGNLERISLGVGGAQPDGASNWATVSIDGRYVAFESRAENLVAADGNGHQDVFLRDRTKGQTILVSQGGDGDSFDAQIAGLGTKLMFTSAATNLVPGDTNGQLDCFLYDLASTSLVRASLDRNGNQIEGSDSTDPAISYTGNQFVFASGGTNLPLYNGFRQIYGARVKNLKPFLLSYGPGNQPGTGHSSAPSIASFAKKVVFTSEAADLVAGDSNGVADLFVFNLDAAGVTRGSVDSSGNQLNGPSTVGALSGDGTKLAFITEASGAASGDGDAQPDAILKDLTTGQTTLVSRDSGGTKANGASGGVSVSLSGARATFGTLATNLQPFDTTNDGDIYVHQPDVGNTILASQAFQPSTGFAGQRTLTVEYRGIPQFIDVNNDGRIDLIWVDRSGSGRSGLIQVALGQADGFGTPTSTGIIADYVTVGQFGGDANIDLVCLSDRDLSWAVGDGTGSFATPTAITTFSTLSRSLFYGLVTADFNGDGYDDILAQRYRQSPSGSPGTDYSQGLIVSGNGAGIFAAPVTVAIEGSIAGLRVGRLDSDSRADLVTLEVVNYDTYSYKLHTRLGTGTTVTTDITTTDDVVSFNLGDYNSDGIDDVVIGLYVNGVHLFLGNGSGGFVHQADYVLPRSATISEPMIADVTGDLVPDLVFDKQYRLEVIPGNGVDLSGTPQVIFPGELRGPLRLLDADDDGDLDLLAMAVQSNTTSADVMVLPNLGGNFWPYSSSPARFAALGDFLGNLFLDVVYATSDATVFEGDGAGGLQAGSGSPLSLAGAEQLIRGDFNKDGLLDLIELDDYSRGTGSQVFLSSGGGSFTAGQTLSISEGGRAADIDGDGDLDVALATTAGLAIWVGVGDGTFTAGPVLPLTYESFFDDEHLELVDLNEDGRLDLVVGRRFDGQLAVALNTGGTDFGSFTFLASAGHPFEPRSADVNHDGHADIIVKHGPRLSTVYSLFFSFSGIPDDQPQFDYHTAAKAFGGTDYAGVGLSCWLGDGAGGLTEVGYQTLPWWLGSTMDIGDLDGDGEVDVALGGHLRSVVALYKGDGTGQFTLSGSWVFPGDLGAIADLNGDGRFDLVGGGPFNLLGK